ncbi:hypothetical protein [Haloarcula argentinensis]|uniref:Uncharacterized protein n=1 Tax=Haloarcula argentinensis TaxID=43776 RepID=A0ABU2F724_HALAR|nr:hypothetical protein [Haloarcula argentinensis]MDS0255821.1 hypothetical protein [Haloarcula argentinensis]
MESKWIPSPDRYGKITIVGILFVWLSFQFRWGVGDTVGVATPYYSIQNVGPGYIIIGMGIVAVTSIPRLSQRWKQSLRFIGALLIGLPVLFFLRTTITPLLGLYCALIGTVLLFAGPIVYYLSGETNTTSSPPITNKE